jgi:hypothetical protein
MVLCSSCDGVPLKFKRKTVGPPVYQQGLFEHSIDPGKNSLDNTFKHEFSSYRHCFLLVGPAAGATVMNQAVKLRNLGKFIIFP